ncbi:MAG: leucine-rich repeat domain-containing protein [Promethearchaeota archaeon]
MSDDLKVIKEISKLTGKELKKIHDDYYEQNLDNAEFFYYLKGDNVIYIGINFYYLDLSEQDQQKVYDSVSNLKSLKGLSLKYKVVDKVPDFIRNFKDLESLNLSDNHLKSLPEWMRELKNLNRLNLETNELASIPDWMKELNNLSHLNVQNNNLNFLPEWLGNLDNLKTLKVVFNNLEWNDISLNVLKSVYKRGGTILAPAILQFQAMHDLPKEKIEIIREIEKDTIQDEKKGRISRLAIKVEDGKVTEWKFVGYGIKSLPENFGIFNNLKSLIISRNQIEALPESFGELKDLEILDLSSNKLTTLPESFVNLTSINNLNLNNNQFSEIPTQLWGLKELTDLDLSNNPLNPEEMVVSQKVPDLIREYLRVKATIIVFISHAVIDFEPYRIEELVKYLEKQKEISQVFFCESDLAGNIDEWMLNAVQKSQLILFIGTNKSVFNSVDCANELQLADKFSIPVIPIKGKDIGWPDLAEINLSRELGLEYNIDNFDQFCSDVYKYIENFKREINLMEKEERRLGIIDIYERFRLMLDEKLSEVIRKIDGLTSNMKSLTDRIENLEKKS